jgi:hypothetical protein
MLSDTVNHAAELTVVGNSTLYGLKRRMTNQPLGAAKEKE